MALGSVRPPRDPNQIAVPEQFRVRSALPPRKVRQLQTMLTHARKHARTFSSLLLLLLLPPSGVWSNSWWVCSRRSRSADLFALAARWVPRPAGSRGVSFGSPASCSILWGFGFSAGNGLPRLQRPTWIWPRNASFGASFVSFWSDRSVFVSCVLSEPGSGARFLCGSEKISSLRTVRVDCSNRQESKLIWFGKFTWESVRLAQLWMVYFNRSIKVSKVMAGRNSDPWCKLSIALDSHLGGKRDLSNGSSWAIME